MEKKIDSQETLQRLMEHDPTEFMDERLVASLLNNLWKMNPKEQRMAYELAVPRIRKMTEREIGDLLGEMAMLPEGVVSNENFLSLARKSLEEREPQYICVKNFVAGAGYSGRGLERVMLAVVENIDQLYGRGYARDAIATISTPYLFRAMGYGDDVGNPEIARTLVGLIEQYCPEERLSLLDGMAKKWAWTVLDEHENYGFSEEGPTKETLKIIIDAGFDPSEILRKVSTRWPGERAQDVAQWLIEAGANWRMADYERGDEDFKKMIEGYAKRERNGLEAIAGLYGQSCTTAVEKQRPKPKM